jgi:hypothetical protein
MVKKRPCACCRKWFWPDPRVGERQRACTAPECQRKRRAQSQAAWSARQPEYFAARRIEDRARRRIEQGRDVIPLRMPRPLDRLPWDLAQDEFGLKGTDFIGLFGRAMLRLAQDEMTRQVPKKTKEIGRHRGAQAQDERPRGA